ncbi:UNVERIFIED_CONTAM: hypothetical protein K2H54_062069 [Gekko kuhli]
MDPGGKRCPVASNGSIKGFWEGMAPEHVKEEPGKGLQQRWEAQWRQFLKVVETPGSEEGHCRQLGRSGCSRFPLDVGQQFIGDEVPQLLIGSLKEGQQPEDASLAKGKAAGRKIKDEFQDRERYEEVILGEDAAGWEAERQRFRQLCYQEMTGPRETYGALRGGDEEMCGEKDSHGESSGEADQPWMSLGEAEQTDCLKSGDTSEDFPQKCEEKLIDSQRCDQGLDGETDQPKILTDEPEETHVQRGEVFQCRPELTDHQPSRTEEEMYGHLDCTEGFCSSSTLVVPQSAHMGVKPFICSACGKSFTDHTVLVAHERTHGAESPWKPMDADLCFPHNSLPVRGRKLVEDPDPGLRVLCWIPVLGPFKEEADDFHKAEEVPSDTWQRVILGEIKQEEEEDAASPGDERAYEEEPENPGELGPQGTLLGRAGQNNSHSLDLGEASESQHVKCPEKEKTVCAPKGYQQAKGTSPKRKRTCSVCGDCFPNKADLGPKLENLLSNFL